MRLATIALRAIIHSRLSSAAVIVSAAVTAMLITGALVVGESVSGTLRAMSEQRLGNATHAIVSPDHFMTGDIARSNNGAAILSRAGSASSSGGETTSRVRIYGIDDAFFRFVRKTLDAPARDSVYINRTLAEHLAVKSGDEIVVRIERPAALASDVTFGATDEPVERRRVTIARILSADEFGSFSLTADAPPKGAVFFSRTELAERIGRNDAADIILLHTTRNALETALQTASPLDKGLIVATNKRGSIEVSTPRIFLPPLIGNALLAAGGRPVFGYFVNAIRGHMTTPYSFAAYSPDITVTRDNGVVINEWLARDTGAAVGEKVTVTYYALAERKLVERTNAFIVERIVPISGAADDPSLMPRIPGLADSTSCRTWTPGMPVDLSRVRDRDEDYWREHRGTPKLFVTLAKAEEMWANDFGSLTAVRFPRERASLVFETIARIPAADAGIITRDLAAERADARASTDFGSLFLGLSAFVIASALLLTGLFFSLLLSRRKEELTTLAAVGFPPKRIYQRMMLEALLLAVLGAIPGSFIAIAYDAVLIALLNAGFSDAAGGTMISLAVPPVTIALGAVISILASLIPVTMILFRSTRASSALSMRKAQSGFLLKTVSIATAALALLLAILNAVTTSRYAVMFFFSAGALLLTAALTSIALLLRRIAGHGAMRSRLMFVARSLTRNRTMSLTSITAIAIGVFLVVAVSASRMDEHDPESRQSGTGGFGLFIETAAASGDDLNAPSVRAKLALDDPSMSNVRFVALSVTAGDDASCRNINRVKRPRLIGVIPDEFAERNAFRFIRIVSGRTNGMHPWHTLAYAEADVIPGIADETTLTWGIQKKLGDEIPYIDDRGRSVRVRIVGVIANSILQGNIIVDARPLARHFPSASRRMFLVDAPVGTRAETARVIANSLRDLGADVMPAIDRLRYFAAVEHAYLSLFLALGGFGLVLGTAAFAALIARALAERRGELAVMRANGCPPRTIISLLIAEYSFLLVLGLAAGSIPAVIAVLPSLASKEIPVIPIIAFIFITALTGMCSIALAASRFMKDDVLAGLRDE
ncbi:MAG: ABC transporter permease [Spirochaetota bacterium]